MQAGGTPDLENIPFFMDQDLMLDRGLEDTAGDPA